MADRRARAVGRLGVKRGERYALVPEEVMASGAYNAQPDWSRSVLFALASRCNGHNNGNMSLPFAEARRLGISAQWKLYAGLRLLERAQLIHCTRRGKLERGVKLASLYAISWRGIDPAEGVELDPGNGPCPLPANGWAKWVRPPDWRAQIKQLTASMRGESQKAQKKPHTQHLGDGRSQHQGATAPAIAPSTWEKERPSTAPSTWEASKTQGLGPTKPVIAGRTAPAVHDVGQARPATSRGVL